MASDSDTYSVWSTSSSAVTKTTATTSGSLSSNLRELDPLLKDLGEKKQSFRSSVVSLAAELKEVKSKLSSKEQSFTRESRTRQEAEEKARKLEEEMSVIKHQLDERNKELETSAAIAQQLEKHRKAHQDLKKRVLKLEFCLHDARSQTRKLQRMCERREKAIKELQDRLSTQQNNADKLISYNQQKIWERPSFKSIRTGAIVEDRLMEIAISAFFSKRRISRDPSNGVMKSPEQPDSNPNPFNLDGLLCLFARLQMPTEAVVS